MHFVVAIHRLFFSLSFCVFLFLLVVSFFLFFLVASFDGLRPLLVTSHCSLRSLANNFVHLFVHAVLK